MPGPSRPQSRGARRRTTPFMYKFLHALLLALSAGVLAACASGGGATRTTQVSPRDIVWKEPSAELSVIYLLRTPHDNTSIAATTNDIEMAKLPAGTYTALQLPPGTYRLGLIEAASTKAAANTFEIEAKPGERRFFYLSGVLETPGKAASVMGALGGAIGGAIIAAARSSRSPTEGSHNWTECTDLDARGLASIGRYVEPTRGTP